MIYFSLLRTHTNTLFFLSLSDVDIACFVVFVAVAHQFTNLEYFGFLEYSSLYRNQHLNNI